MQCATCMVIYIIMFYETLESRNHNSIHKIIIVFNLLCFFNSCSSIKPCMGSLNCGDCGVCMWNNNTNKEFCETSYLKQIFDQNPPTCSLTNACKPKNPCLNGGTCETKFGSYSCLCTNQYHGEKCQVHHDANENHPSGLLVAYFPIVKLLETIKILISVDNIGHDSIRLGFYNGDEQGNSYDKTVWRKGFTRKICEDEIGYTKACNTIPKSKQSQYMIIKTVYTYSTEGNNLIVQSDGPKVIGRHIQFDIDIYNYKSDLPSLQYKFPCVLDYRLQKSVDCIPTVQLKNCGRFKRKTTRSIRSIVKPNQNCEEKEGLILEWNIYTFGENFDEERNLLESRSKVTEYVIPQFSMVEGMYKVRLSVSATVVRDKMSETQSNFAYCYFEIVEDPLTAMIKGGNIRNVYSDDVVILDGSRSSDPNEPPNEQNHLTYVWQCDLLETVCNAVVSKESRYTVGQLRVGEVYTFTLTVKATGKNRKPAFTTQVISVIASKIADVEIVCLQNCGENIKSNINEIIYFKIEVVGNSSRSKDMDFSWKYSEKSGPVQSVDSIREMDTPNDILIIKANMLQEGSSFDFRVEVVGSEAQSSITVITDHSPEGGSCTISPESGVAATSFFAIVCRNFAVEDDDVTGLNYEFYAGEPSTGVLLGCNTNGEFKKVVLSQNNITVRISNSFGMFVDKHIFVQIDPLNATSQDITTLILNAYKLQRYGDNAGSIRLISAISDLIAELDNKLQTSRILLEIMDKVRVIDFDDVKLYSLVLKKLVTQGVQGELNGLDRNCCKITSALMLRLSRKVFKIIVNSYNVSTDITTYELQTIVRTLLEIGDMVVNSRDPIIYNESAGALQVLDVYNIYKNAASDVVTSIEMLGRSIGHRLLPSQPEVVIKTNNSTLWVKFDTPKRLSNKTQTFSFGNNSVKISEKLMEALKTKSDLIRLEVAVLYGNPFWWDQNEKNIVSDIVLLRFFVQVSNQIIQIRNLQEAVDIFLKLKLYKTQIIDGMVTMPNLNATEDEKDSAVSVHRIDSPPRGGNGKVAFHFMNIKPNDTLKVLVMKNMWPDYDFVSKEGRTITNTSYIYEVFLTDESPDMFLYIGLLPGSEVLPGVTISYTFEISNVQCQIRSGGEWNSDICKVGNLTRNDLIHCQCTHLSIFGGSFLIAPNKLDLIKDISLFLTFPDNPTVVILVVTLLIIYLSTLVWAFLKDGRDKLQKIVIVLEDNYPGEKWGYLLTVFTGARMFAGTTANVGFEIIGKLSHSRAHVFRSRNRKVLQKGSDDWFLIFTSKHLGELERLHIWHDNSGSSPDWYCVKIVVHDLVFKKEYSFLVESWFCIGTYGKFVEAMLKPSLLKDITHWDRLVMSNAFYYFREAHLWMSIFYCHPRTCLTRSHRVSIATSLIMSSLLTSIMFYGIAAVEGVDEGSYSIKTREIIIAIQSALITTPITFLIVFFFRKSRIVREVKHEPVEEESFKKYTEIKESDINERDDSKYVSNVVKNDNNKSVVVTSGEKGTETCIKRIFLYLSSIVHLIIKPKPLTPIQISNIPTTTVVERPKFAIIGWILCQTCIWVSALFIMLYGLKLGKITSELWMTATLFAIAQGIFISSPIKLFIYSFILALAFQKLYDVTTFEVNLSDAMRLDKVGDKDFLTNLIQLRSQPEYHPLPRLTLLGMHKRKMPTKSWAPVLKFGIVSIFTIILLIAVGDLWSAKFYTNNAHIKTMLKTTRVPQSVSFNDASNINRFGEYLLTTLIPAVYTSKWYNKSPLSSKDERYSSNEWTNDASTRLLNVPRLRQIRVKPDVCVIPDLLKNITITCSSSLSDATEDTRNYDSKWRHRFNISKSSPWVYNPRSNHLYLYGTTGQAYHDGGYICDLGLTHKESNVIMTQLIDNRWVDQLTRVLFIEFVLYNINTDVTSLVYLMAEKMPSEAFFSRIEVVSFSASMTLRAKIWIVILMFFIIVFVFQILVKISGLGLRQFVLSFWNMLELCVCVLCIICLIVHIVQIVTTSLLLENFQKIRKEEHLNMSLLMIYNYRMLFSLVFLIFLTILWIFKCFKLGYNIQTIYSTLKLCYPNIIWSVLVLVLFLIYIGWILSYIFNSPIFSNFTIVGLYRMSRSNISSERISSSQKLLKICYCYTCALGSVFCMITISYYRRLGKHYRYDLGSVNIWNIIKNKLKSMRANCMKHGRLRLRGGTDIVYNTKNVFICNHLKICIPKILHQTNLGLLNKNEIFNFLENQNKISLTNSNSKYKTNGNIFLKNEDICLKVTPSHNYTPADFINKHKFRVGITYDNCYSLDNSYYFERMLFNLDYIIEKLKDIEDICNNEIVVQFK